MSLADWLREQIDRSNEILEDLDRGVRHYRGVAGQEMVDVTDKYRAETEARLARNADLLKVVEAHDA